MKVTATTEVREWLSGLEPGTARHRFAYAELRFLQRLERPPNADQPPTLKRVRQARRHPIWRVSHPYHPDVAIRILCWFPDDATALAAGDKAAIGDLWYDSAVPRAELHIDQWKRTHP